MKQVTRARIINVYLQTIGKHWDDITAYERTVLTSFADELLRQVNGNDMIKQSSSQDKGSPSRPITPEPLQLRDQRYMIVDDYGICHSGFLVEPDKLRLTSEIYRATQDAEKKLITGWLNWVESGGGHIDRTRLREELAQLHKADQDGLD